jgi:sugar phosphate isomerase/epimerase
VSREPLTTNAPAAGVAEARARRRGNALPWRLGALAPSEYCDVLADAGYDYLEIACGEFRLELPESEFAVLRRRLARCPLPVEVCSMFLPRDFKLVGPRIGWERFTSCAEVELRRAAELGAKIVLWANGPSRTIPEGYPRERATRELVRAGRFLAELAERHDLVLAFEPLKPSSSNFILTLAEGLDFVGQVDRPRVRPMADMFHMRENHEPWDNIARLRDVLQYVHLCDHDRRAPGNTPGDRDSYRAVFRTLDEIGYRGRVSIEAEWRDLPAEAPAAVLALENAARQELSGR